MQFDSLLFAQAPLHVVAMKITPEGVTLDTMPVAEAGFCPCCAQRSIRIHSHHCRTLADVPAHGQVVCIRMHLRRFFCDFPDCPQHTFAEQLPLVARPHARKTERLHDALRETAFTAGGEAGARLARQLGMPVSGDTLLRLIRQEAALTTFTAPRVLGVDDWALRRGQVYGTILCDLESHHPVDLLPERSADVLAAWLKEHPGAQIISRDRGGDYAKGASIGAPGAIQVADRWHLLHNLTEALQRAVDHRHALLGEVAREVAGAAAPAASGPPDTEPTPPVRQSIAEQKRQASRDRRMARYEKVRELHQQGMSMRKICRTLKLSREAVVRFIHSEQFPERATPTRGPILIDPFLPFLKQRWEEGCDNVKHLWREIKGKGFTGSVHMVRLQVRRWRRSSGRRCVRGPQPRATAPRIIRPSARRIAWLALGHMAQPTDHDKAILAVLFQRWPELQETAELAKQFTDLFKARDANSLEAWAQLAEGSMTLPEVRRFAEVLRQDWPAVVEAVKQPWSQGQVEGQINRLKLIKRQMYGRANFDLLRQRVLRIKHA